jgi:MFS family permease
MMEKKPGKKNYSRFESMSMGKAVGAASIFTEESSQVVNPSAARVDKSQQLMSKWVILALAASASFMTTLDGSIVNIGLPSISSTFHAGISGATEWIIIGYLVVIAASLLTFGRLADMLGRKPIFMLGLIIFILGSMLCGLAPSLLLLILARLFQGIGGALIFAVNTACSTWCTTLITRNERENYSLA